MPDNNIVPGEPGGEFLLYESEDGAARVEVRLADGTVWLTQKLMAELFETSVPNINIHLKNTFAEGELREGSVIKDYLITAADGKRYTVAHYRLEAIIAVGYRVRSHRGTQFRRWATALLKEYVVKGFVLDDERLRDGGTLGRDYFDELLERIRDIRASERRFYQKITDIYATSIDYDPRHATTHEFFATVKNKLHWAAHGHTAAEVIAERADATRPHMGLTSWRTAPSGKVRRQDVSIAQNYLTEDELRALNRIVTQYLDYAEDQAQRRRPMRMADWRERLDAFLQFNEREVLEDTGRVSHEVAKRLAETEFDAYEAECRRIEATEPSSDFDRFLEDDKGLGAEGDADEAG